MAYIGGMRHLTRYMAAALFAGAALAAGPAPAAEDAPPPAGLELFFEDGKRILEGLMQDMEPALRELQEALRGLEAYEAPEMLPNGDIIIRRKRPEATAPDEGPVDI